MTTTDGTPDPTSPASEPNYDRIAAEMMQQWQQQFLQPVLKPEFTEALGKGGTVAQSMMEMGQVLWQSWLSGNPGDAAAPEEADAKPGETAYAAPDAAAVHNPDAATAAGAHASAAAAAGPDGSLATPAAAPAVHPDANASASMASVALCAELARRLDLLSQRVARLESQLEQQLANK